MERDEREECWLREGVLPLGWFAVDRWTAWQDSMPLDSHVGICHEMNASLADSVIPHFSCLCKLNQDIQRAVVRTGRSLPSVANSLHCATLQAGFFFYVVFKQ